MDTLIAWIMRAIPFGTIIMYGAMGEIVTEKSGNLNLGVPGIMYLGGFAGFASAYLYENSAANPNMALCVVISLFCAFITSMLGGLIYSFLTISLRANQNVTGLALTTFGMGVANFFGVYILNGRTATQSMVYKTFQTKLPVLPNLGIIGQTLFNYGFMVYAAIILAVILHHVLNHTRTGLNLRAIGENPATADAAGISVTKYKYWATCLGAGISGLGGLYYWITTRAFGQPPHRSKRWAGWPSRWSSLRPGSHLTQSGVRICSACSTGCINFCQRCCTSLCRAM